MTISREMKLRTALQNMLLTEQRYNDSEPGFATTRTLHDVWDAMIFAVRDHLPAVLDELQRLRSGEIQVTPAPDA